MKLRIVRFPIADGVYECVVTNLPRDEFPLERIQKLYFSRWGIETLFCKLKYTVGLSNFHAYKPEYVKQEIWARMITYNLTKTIVNHAVIEKGETKHEYKINFSSAVQSAALSSVRQRKKDQSMWQSCCKENWYLYESGSIQDWKLRIFENHGILFTEQHKETII